MLKNIFGFNALVFGLTMGALCIGLSGCDELHGDIKLTDKVFLRGEGNKRSEVLPGVYPVTVDFPSQNLVRVTLNDKVGQGAPEALIHVDGATFPQYNGEFDLKAGENNQEFEIKGVVRTVEDRSTEETRSVRCQYLLIHQECDSYGKCRYHLVYRPGHQDESFYNTIYRRRVSLNLISNHPEENRKNIGELYYYQQWSKETVTSQSYCRMD